MGIPPRLIAAMQECEALDVETSQALAQAIVESFGPCVCQKHVWNPNGFKGFVELCQGHAFLMEDDTACTRIQHLRFVRAMAGRFQVAEHGLAECIRR